eukprot:gene4849-1578_t
MGAGTAAAAPALTLALLTSPPAARACRGDYECPDKYLTPCTADADCVSGVALGAEGDDW